MTTFDIESAVNIVLLSMEEPGDMLAMSILYCLSNMKARTWLITDGKAQIYRYSRHCNTFVQTALPAADGDVTTFAGWLSNFIKRNSIDCILASDIAAVRLLGKVSPWIEHCGMFPMSSPDVIDRLDDKWEFSQLLDHCGIAKPTTIYLTCPEDLDSPKIDTIGWPLVLKAQKLSGRRGFKKCHSIAEVRNHVGGKSPYSALPLLAQEYIPGGDIDFGFLAVQGEVRASAVFCRYPGGRAVDFVRDQTVERIGRQIVQATGYTGVGTIDFRKEADSERRLPLEFNPRFWYSISKAMWLGVNFVELGIALAHRKEPPAATVEPGRWISPGNALRSQILGRRRKGEVSRGSMKSAYDVLSDPLPILYTLMSRMGFQL